MVWQRLQTVFFREAGPASEIPPADRRQLLARDSCSTFLYYATGSRRCKGVLVRIELASRHDLFMLLWGLLNPAAVRTTDRVTVEVAFGDDDVEPVIFAVAPKRDAKRLLRDVPHLQEYTTATTGPASLAPLGLVCLSESSALVDLLLQPAVKALSEHAGLLELLHVTDQNEEPILGQEETPRKALRFAFRLPEGDSVGPAKMMALALDYIDILTRRDVCRFLVLSWSRSAVEGGGERARQLLLPVCCLYDVSASRAALLVSDIERENISS